MEEQEVLVPASSRRCYGLIRLLLCLRGRLVEEFYDELERICTEAIELSPGGPVVALNIPIGQWHTARALESGTVILECKDGAYEPLGEGDILGAPGK